jgi:hypothetical protein
LTAANEIVLRVIAALDAAAVPYMLVGSYSSNAFGIPRSTQDADFVIESGDRPLTPVFDAVRPEIQFDSQMQVEMVTMTYRYVATHRDSGFKVELFLVSSDAHDVARFERRRRQPFLGATAILPTPEDVVIQKLRWAARAGRSKDRDDARAVLAVQGAALDMAYIRTWCDQHGTRQLLEELLKAISDSTSPA